MANAVRTGVIVLDFKHDAHHSLIVPIENPIYVLCIRDESMTVIEATVEINADIDKVWKIVSDLDNEPRFWKGTKSVQNISKEGNVIQREVTIAFKDKKCKQAVTLFPQEKIEIVFTEGIIDGTKTIFLTPYDNKTKLAAIWDIKLSGMMGMFTAMVKRHIEKGTEQALQSIKEEAER